MEDVPGNDSLPVKIRAQGAAGRVQVEPPEPGHASQRERLRLALHRKPRVRESRERVVVHRLTFGVGRKADIEGAAQPLPRKPRMSPHESSPQLLAKPRKRPQTVGGRGLARIVAVGEIPWMSDSVAIPPSSNLRQLRGETAESAIAMATRESVSPLELVGACVNVYTLNIEDDVDPRIGIDADIGLAAQAIQLPPVQNCPEAAVSRRVVVLIARETELAFQLSRPGLDEGGIARVNSRNPATRIRTYEKDLRICAQPVQLRSESPTAKPWIRSRTALTGARSAHSTFVAFLCESTPDGRSTICVSREIAPLRARLGAATTSARQATTAIRALVGLTSIQTKDS